MAKWQGEFAHESLQDRETIVRYLEALSKGIQSGQLLLASDNEKLILETPNLVRLEVRARQRNGRAYVALKIGWDNRSKQSKTNVESLVIEHPTHHADT